MCVRVSHTCFMSLHDVGLHCVATIRILLEIMESFLIWRASKMDSHKYAHSDSTFWGRMYLDVVLNPNMFICEITVNASFCRYLYFFYKSQVCKDVAPFLSSHFCKSAPETVLLGYLIIVPVCIVTMDAQLQSIDDLSTGENTHHDAWGICDKEHLFFYFLVSEEDCVRLSWLSGSASASCLPGCCSDPCE